MCGIVGVVATTPVNQLLYDALQLLQHRGQDAAGIATGAAARFQCGKATSGARNISHRNMRNLAGNVGIAHVRYPTAGSASNAGRSPAFFTSTRRRDHTRPQRQPDQHRGADAGDVPQGSAPHQHAI